MVTRHSAKWVEHADKRRGPASAQRRRVGCGQGTLSFKYKEHWPWVGFRGVVEG